MYVQLDVARAHQQLAMERACRHRLARSVGGGTGRRLQRLLRWGAGTVHDGPSADLRDVATSGDRGATPERPAA